MELELLNLLEQDDTPVGHKFDNLPLSHVLTNYFGGKREAARNYLEKKNEEFTLWRLRHYSPEDIKNETEDGYHGGIEKVKIKVEEWLEKLEEQAELKENDEWADYEYAQALFHFLVQEGDLNEEDDVYSMFFERDYDGLHEFEIKEKYWAICKEEDADDLAKERVKSLFDDIGIEGFSPGFIDNYIDGEKLAEYMDFDSDVRENPEVYLDESSDREFSDEQKSEIEEKENQIETLQEEQSELDTDTPEGEERYEEIDTEISNLEDEIESIRESPEGDWNEEAIERVVLEKEEEVESDPAGYLKSMGYDKNFIKQFIDEDELAQGVVDADGRGVQLAGYDHVEHNFTWEEIDYCIYRTN